jgi:hypothetical protein
MRANNQFTIFDELALQPVSEAVSSVPRCLFDAEPAQSTFIEIIVMPFHRQPVILGVSVDDGIADSPGIGADLQPRRK